MIYSRTFYLWFFLLIFCFIYVKILGFTTRSLLSAVLDICGKWWKQIPARGLLYIKIYGVINMSSFVTYERREEQFVLIRSRWESWKPLQMDQPMSGSVVSTCACAQTKPRSEHRLSSVITSLLPEQCFEVDVCLCRSLGKSKVQEQSWG